MSEIILSIEDQPEVLLSKEDSVPVNLTHETNDIILSEKGIKGDKGDKGDPGEVAGASWMDIAGNIKYTNTVTTLPSGEVEEGEYIGGTIYRFTSTALDSNGYEVEDSFYSNFDGTNLTNLLATRG